MTDLFGNADPGAYIPGDLFEGAPRSTVAAVADLRETWQRAERASQLRPDDEHLARRAAQARRDWLQVRDYARSMSAAEVAADRAASGAERCNDCGLRSCPGDCDTAALPF